MLDFDKKIKDMVVSISGEYYRYCDDMLFIIDSDKTSELISIVTQSISELKIEINDKKTEVRNFVSIHQDGVEGISSAGMG